MARTGGLVALEKPAEVGLRCEGENWARGGLSCAACSGRAARWPRVPLAGGLHLPARLEQRDCRQPVHHSNLARACMAPPMEHTITETGGGECGSGGGSACLRLCPLGPADVDRRLCRCCAGLHRPCRRPCSTPRFLLTAGRLPLAAAEGTAAMAALALAHVAGLSSDGLHFPLCPATPFLMPLIVHENTCKADSDGAGAVRPRDGAGPASLSRTACAGPTACCTTAGPAGGASLAAVLCRPLTVTHASSSSSCSSTITPAPPGAGKHHDMHSKIGGPAGRARCRTQRSCGKLLSACTHAGGVRPR